MPLRVLFLDQEAEWQGTIDIVERVMTMKDVIPMWYQIPMRITNNASSYAEFNLCWDKDNKDKWIHPQHPVSIKENKYGTDRFHDLFKAIFRVEFAGTKACYVAGMRASELPKRFMCLTGTPSYKWITWENQLDKNLQHYTFYPIYDWETSDVWKAIHDNKWDYNKVYDEYYRYGLSINKMRISNLHHETAVRSLMFIQEIEPATWERVAARISGANSIKHMKDGAFVCPAELPRMFDSWEEYMNHIIENIVLQERHRVQFRKSIDTRRGLQAYAHESIKTAFIKSVINAALSSDWEGLKIKNFIASPGAHGYRKWTHWRRGFGVPHEAWLHNQFIPEGDKPEIVKALDGGYSGRKKSK